ncbi:MAG: tRNA dihydrouridine(20/20a) synthase DusA [Proteobacteria bacterium]|nr:MAG: tRNA dihydrouridine(20/20a) synthase DusA [Pseudomonadota bacterium]
MLDWTDRHERYFLRLLSKHAWLYTEMVTTGALIHGDYERYLKFNHQEHPVALQLGGSDPRDMVMCAKMAEDFGYDEVNINVGCPSDRVQRGAFGACLMAEPELIATCVAAMQEAVSIPVTVKNRIGIDDQNEAVSLRQFISTVAEAGCKTFVIHARKAWLKGLSPKQNRDIPPLNYDLVYQIKQESPELEIIINGGINTLEECTQHLQSVDGVMVGREAYHNPYHLVDVDATLYNDTHPKVTRLWVLDQYIAYIEARLSEGVPLKHMTRHILGLFQGVTGAKAWRRHISEQAYKPDAGIDVLRHAASYIKESE